MNNLSFLNQLPSLEEQRYEEGRKAALKAIKSGRQIVYHRWIAVPDYNLEYPGKEHFEDGYLKTLTEHRII